MKSTRKVLGHSLLHSLVRSHRSLIRLLRTARFARALRCAHSFSRSLTHSLTHSGAHGKEVSGYGMNASIAYSFKPLCDGSAAQPYANWEMIQWRLDDGLMEFLCLFFLCHFIKNFIPRFRRNFEFFSESIKDLDMTME